MINFCPKRRMRGLNPLHSSIVDPLVMMHTSGPNTNGGELWDVPQLSLSPHEYTYSRVSQLLIGNGTQRNAETVISEHVACVWVQIGQFGPSHFFVLPKQPPACAMVGSHVACEGQEAQRKSQEAERAMALHACDDDGDEGDDTPDHPRLKSFGPLCS